MQPNSADRFIVTHSELRAKLLAISGKDVRQPYSDADMALLATQGTLMKGPIKVRPGVMHRCHYSAAVHWLKHPKDAIYIGYQKPYRDCWTQHSWNVRDGVILDTDDREFYFGVIPADPESFAAQVICDELGHLDPERIERILGVRAWRRFHAIMTRFATEQKKRAA